MWIDASLSPKRRAAARTMTRPRCAHWSTPPTSGSPSGWCWPMPSSIVSVTITISVTPLRAHSVIPAKRGGADWRIQGVRAQMRQEFPEHLYRRRALIESIISAVKRKLSESTYGISNATLDQAMPLTFPTPRHSWSKSLKSAIDGLSGEPSAVRCLPPALRRARLVAHIPEQRTIAVLPALKMAHIDTY
jgi:hypothetical protein